jgi:CubicO group peptidase (beta-lactamase class C family)
MGNTKLGAVDLDGILDRAAVGHAVAGASVCLLDAQGMIRRASTGVLRLGDPEPAGPGTIFPLGSVTKPFTAVVVCQLVAEGRIGLDDPVVSVLPDLAVLGPTAGSITVRMLLCHTSGLPDAWERYSSPAELLAAAREAGPVADPGKIFSYTNTGYVVLGRLIEVLTGQTFEDAVRSRVFDRVGVTSATFAPPRRLPATAASGHVTDGAGGLIHGDLWPPTGRLFGPAGGTLHATAADTARLVLACVTGRDPHGQALLPAGLQHEMLTEQITLPGLPLHYRGWALGWGVPVGLDGVSRAVQHIGGTSALVHADPDRGVAIAVLTNFPEGWEFGRDVVRAVLDLPEELPPIGDGAVDPRRYVGEYRSPAFGISVREENGRLRITNPLTGSDVDLHHQGGDAFWADFGELVTEVTFFDVAGGRAQRMHSALRMLQRVEA